MYVQSAGLLVMYIIRLLYIWSLHHVDLINHWQVYTHWTYCTELSCLKSVSVALRVVVRIYRCKMGI